MIPSYHDLNNENSYHMMMLGMCLCLSDNYKVIYNREEGKGRCDLIIQAHDEKKTSFIIEFKYFKEDKKDFEKALDKLSNEFTLYIGFFIAIFVSMFVGKEHSEGIIRNKIIVRT